MKSLVLVLGLAATLPSMAQPKAAPVAKRSITIVNYETEGGVKQWLPGTIIAKKGETVELKLINNVPSGIHGFFIPAFNVRKEVKKGTPETVSFVADKDGLFDLKCHLHPAHVGGQLLVLP